MAGPAKSLVINEIFYSVQGESTRAGCPCVFVRLTGCDLRCSYCDTEYAFHEGRRMAIGEIVDQVLGYGCGLVEITGGEPLLQTGVYALCDALLAADREVMIETSGAADVARLDPRVIKVMDLKCPGSGEVHRNRWENLGRLSRRDEIKFVIGDRRDYEWARAVIAEHQLQGRVGALLLSPVFGKLEPRLLAGWLLEDRLVARLQLQLHKHIWPPHWRGV